MRPGRCAPFHVLASAALLITLLVACGDDGRELRPPAAGQTYTPTSTTIAGGVVGSTAATTVLSFSSPGFEDGASIPDRFTCDGEDVSPALQWNGLPAATTEVAIVVTDADANQFVHWVVAGLDPSLTSIAEGELPEGAVVSRNGFGEIGWRGPCPPGGEHTYVFALFAHAEPIGMRPGVSPDDAQEAAVTGNIATSTFVGTYERGD